MITCAYRALRVCSVAIAAATLTLGILSQGTGEASAATPGVPWWRLNVTVAPSLLPHDGEAQIVVDANNLGDAEVDAATSPVVLTDTLPAGPEGSIEAVEVLEKKGAEMTCSTSAAQLRCVVSTGTILPYQSVWVRLRVRTSVPEAVTQLPNTLTVEGGQAPSGAAVASPPAVQKPLRLAPGAGETQPANERVPFGVETLEMTPEGTDGSLKTRAGSHPFQFTTTLDLDQTLQYYPPPLLKPGFFPSSPALAKELRFKLPPGLIADTTAVARCPYALFATKLESWTDQCPADTAVGVAIAEIFPPSPLTYVFHEDLPIFNLEPAPGQPARYGFVIDSVPIVLNANLPAGGDYAAEVSVQNISQVAQLLSTQVVFWGTPDDPAHDHSRGWECLANRNGNYQWDQWKAQTPCTPLEDHAPTAMLTLPTACTPLHASMTGHSWPTGEPGNEGEPLATEHTSFESSYSLTSCETLAFNPSFTTTLETPFASTPAGITGTLTFPQPGLTEPEGRAESALSDTTLTLPEGLQVNPSAANGLAACTEEQAGYTGQNSTTGIYQYTPEQPHCPEASKVATLHARTPLLEEELTGALYVMEPAPNGEAGKNPFNALVGLYVVLEAPRSGILVKLGADVHLDPSTGREQAVFPGTPQLPFHELTLSFFGGPRAATASPAFCGTYQVAGQFTGFSGASSDPLSEPPFQITAGPEGTACPQGHLPFAPSFTAGPHSAQAGALTPLLVKIGHPDGNQPLTGISVTEPPGFAAVLASVTPCQEPPPGVEWSCGEDSHIGEAREHSGLGPEPVAVTGQAYLTTGYDGAPFGLLVRTLAKAGPFNLGYVNVRSRINVNPSTAQVTVTTDPGPRGESVPTMLKGIPVDLKALEVAINRPGFTFNPTSCEPLTTTATLTGSEGASANVSAPFKAQGCTSLPFHPTLEASTAGQASKADGASLDVKVTSQGLGVANIQKVFLTIPKILPSRLQPTLQHACLAAVFEANPAGCDEDSLIGYATVHTPVLKSPLTGPGYVVSHGGAAFPDTEFVLQGEGITLVLDGKTDIKKGVTYSRFESTPDAPFTTFEAVLPEGPHSILGVNTEEAPNYSLCGHKITIPTVITAQDGAVIEQTTQVAVTGCGGVKGYKATNAQLLAKALKKCKKDKRKRKRVACEKAARKKYPVKAAKKKIARATRRDRRAAGRRG